MLFDLPDHATLYQALLDRNALKAEVADLEKQARGKLGVGNTEPAQQIKTELAAFFEGMSADFSTPLAFAGSPFARQVCCPPGLE